MVIPEIGLFSDVKLNYIRCIVRKSPAMAFSLTPRQLLQAKEAIEMLSNSLSGENQGESTSSGHQVVQSPKSQPIQQPNTCTRSSEASDGMYNLSCCCKTCLHQA